MTSCHIHIEWDNSLMVDLGGLSVKVRLRATKIGSIVTEIKLVKLLLLRTIEFTVSVVVLLILVLDLHSSSTCRRHDLVII
jgi:hypothetical protein